MSSVQTVTAGATSPKVTAGAASGLGSGGVGVVIVGFIMTTSWWASLPEAAQAVLTGGLPVLLAGLGHLVGGYLAPLLPGKTTADVEALAAAARNSPDVMAALDRLTVDVRSMLDHSGDALVAANGAVQLATRHLAGQTVSSGVMPTGDESEAVTAVSAAPSVSGDDLSGLDG